MFSPEPERTAVNERPKIKFRSGNPKHRIFPTEWDNDTFRRKGIEGFTKSMLAYAAAGYAFDPGTNTPSTVEELEVALEAERAQTRFLRMRLHAIENPTPKGGKAAQILRDVAADYGIDVPTLISMNKTPFVLNARYEAAYRLREEAKLTFPVIGRLMGNRDHSTIVHACRRHKERLAK